MSTHDSKDPSLEVETRLLADAPVVIGMDEVGRGAIAGPVAVGAQVVTADLGSWPPGLRDSKLLTERRREAIEPLLNAWGIGAVGFADAPEIDAFGITEMLGEAGFRALTQIADAGVDLRAAVILLDGAHDWLTPVIGDGVRVLTRVRADRECVSVAAASVRAKVARDRLMRAADATSPGYAWSSNKGYGSAAHYAGIRALGLTELHRHTWIRTE